MAKRILIADDSVTIQKAFAMTFAGEDLTLGAARSADEGLSLAQRARPDLVIADGVMPGRSGYDLCAAVKSDPGLRGVPVFILASNQNPFDEARARQCAADGHFLKPFDTAAIVSAVNDALAKGAGGTMAPAPTLEPRPAPVDDYGEISVGTASGSGSGVRPGAALSPSRGQAEDEVTPPPTAPSRPAAPPPAHVSPTPPAPVAAPVMRPSLIPGMRPGLPGARPGAVPARPSPVPGPQAMPLRPAAPQAPPMMASGTRTMMGLPAGGLQPPPRTTAPSYPAQPAPASPVRAVPSVESRTPPPAVAGSAAAQAVSAVSSRVAAQLASIAARGPEYEAIAKLSREIIEKIAWEIVPELAETIIREELQKRGRV